MKNIDRIKQMTDEDLAMYIESVFVAGRMYEASIQDSIQQMENYNEWLEKDVINNG